MVHAQHVLNGPSYIIGHQFKHFVIIKSLPGGNTAIVEYVLAYQMRCTYLNIKIYKQYTVMDLSTLPLAKGKKPLVLEKYFS